MVVAAIVVPILIFYFYRKTTKERQQYLEKWNKIGEVDTHHTLKGTILKVSERKERYYQHYFIRVIELWIHSDRGNQKALLKEPVNDQLTEAPFMEGQEVMLNGQWSGQHFLFKTFSINSNVHS